LASFYTVCTKEVPEVAREEKITKCLNILKDLPQSKENVERMKQYTTVLREAQKKRKTNFECKNGG
jgi:hypothetical protein